MARPERKVISRKQKVKKPLDVELLRNSFSALKPQAKALVARFYELLFERYPEVESMFSNTSMEQQQEKLLAALVMVLDMLERPEELTAALATLGDKHRGFGVLPEHYQAVTDTLLEVMAEFGGDLWTKKVAKAWQNALTQITEMMMRNDESKEDAEMAGANTVVKGNEIDVEEAVRMRAAVNGAMTAIMMVDRDLTVTYANDATIKLLREHETALRAIFPSFTVDGLVGSCIDMFHKNPAHQRQMLANPANLPYSTDIQVGPLTFRINVTAVHDDAGNYLGNSMEWSDVTALRLKESENLDFSGQIEAISKAQAVIEFNMDGTIITANDNFLNALGYRLDEVQGMHHSMFVDPEFKVSTEYQEFWKKLNRGEYEQKEYKRIGKGGKEVWIQASYNPIKDKDGNPYKVVKYATDITEEKMRYANFSGQIAAIGKSQAIIEFNMDGTIITANDNFLGVVGYSMDEIKDKHHSMFVEPEFKASIEYQQFWEKLNRGEYEAKEYKRIGKGGKEVWIQASYNPIMDLNGKPFKVVKYATDITDQKVAEDEMKRLQSAIDGAMTSIMMIDRDLTVTYANDSTVALLKKHEVALKSLFPSFDVSKIVGSCIDMFHANPAHQRQLLSNPSNLPYETDIHVGPLIFRINVTALHDVEGEYVGNTMEWSDVTEARKSENEANRLQSAIDNAMTSIMMIDRDLVITYANPSTIALLKKHEVALKAVYPAFDPSKLIGSCIDMFHANPAHQRQLLANSANLPHTADIKVGDLTFSINVTAMHDLSGEYIGNTMEWSDVTEARQSEADASRLQSAIDNAMTSIMMIDRDLVITYANPSTIALLKKHEVALKAVYPAFDPSKLIGSCIDMFHANPAHQRQLLANPANLPHTADIKVGDLTFSINVTAMHDLNDEYIGNTMEWSDVTEARASELEVTMLKSAIDGANANIMLCDTDLKITYVNPAVVNMLTKRESTLRERFAGFDPRNLIGTCIDIFHKNPAHQRQLLGNAANLPASAEIKIADLEFTVNATAILDSQGNLMGNMVEWGDITEQKDAERQIEELISAARVGDLSKRVDAEKYEGFLKGLSIGINSLLETISAPIQEGTRVMKALAEGVLTETMQGEYEGDFAVLRDAIDTSVNNLRNMVADIRIAGSAITSGAGEIAQGNADLSQRTEEQASSLEETASSMEELTSTVRQNADNAKQANQLASGARDQAEKGGEVVGKAVTAMSEINASSKKIADIISVIDEIAFQTNLLALNAAVEAARAGEQGRGFAVVAGEVRNLAQRSAAAAKEIKSLINDSVEKVLEGTKLVDLSGQTLAEIVDSVKKVSDIIAEISAASQEQSTGIDQVNKAISQMDEVTQQNAALVEEAAAASESMDEQAKGLEMLMNFFKTGDDDVTPQPRRGTAKPRQAAAPGARPTRKASKPADDEWEEF